MKGAVKTLMIYGIKLKLEKFSSTSIFNVNENKSQKEKKFYDNDFPQHKFCFNKKRKKRKNGKNIKSLS